MNTQILDRHGNPIKAAAKAGDKAMRVLTEMIRVQHTVYRREINHWQNARQNRKSIHNPLTWDLQTIYEDAMIDTHLTSVIEDRILRILNKDIIITAADGSKDEDKTKAINDVEWFTEIVKMVMESPFYEYSLIYLIPGKKGIQHVELVPRENTQPDDGTILENYQDRTSGQMWADYPESFLFSKLYSGYGLLEKASSLTILKRHSWGNWDEFEQVFGMPIRIAKVATMSDDVRDEVAGWLKTMGTAAYGVFPHFADIEIKEANNRDAFNVFMKKIDSVNSELSKLIVHQTMTTDNGSSLSQAEVHQDTLDEVTKADLKKTLLWLNHHLKPYLISIGYPIAEENAFAVAKVTDPSEKIKIDAQLMTHGYKPTREYVERTYGVELEEAVDPDPEDAPAEEDPKKKS